jgi:hypothetical protein
MFKRKNTIVKKQLDGYRKESLTYLADKYKSDKGVSKHNYTALYEMLFASYKEKKINIIEMGLLVGGPEHGNDASRETKDLPSIKMWLEYFSKAHITGVDISDFSWFENDRFDFVQVDMGKRDEFKKIKDHAKKATIIIEDASHASDHQQYAFLELFSQMPSGGLYIIEDLQWQPDFSNKKFPLTSKLLEDYNINNRFTHSDKKIEDELNQLKDSISGCFLFTNSYSKYGDYKVAVLQKK